MSIIFRVQFYDPAKARAYRSEYLEQVGITHKIARIERSVIGTLGEFRGWDKIGAWQAPTLIVYRYQDFEPITQAFTLKEWIPQARLSFLNECGHWPWLEQHESIYDELQAFLGLTRYGSICCYCDKSVRSPGFFNRFGRFWHYPEEPRIGTYMSAA